MSAIIANSVFAERLLLTGEFYAFDIDGTLAKGQATPSQIKAREDLRRISRQSAEIFNTMRPPEEIYSDWAFESIGSSGLVRPKPNPDLNPVDRALLEDPHLGISIGLPPVWEQQDCSFKADLAYMARNGRHWRADFMEVIERIDPSREIRGCMHAVESPENYRNGTANVLPMSHRCNFTFSGDDEGKQQYLRVMSLIEEGLENAPGMKVVFVDESDPPRQHSFYAMPPGATKEAALEQAVYATAEALHLSGAQIRDTRGTYVGDSLTDLNAGLRACPDMDMTCIIPAEARIAPYLFGEKKGPFATTSFDATLDCLDDTDELGIFRYQEGSARPRLVILGGYVFTTATSVTESVLESVLWLKRHRERSAA
jgi:hypothetical protein